MIVGEIKLCFGNKEKIYSILEKPYKGGQHKSVEKVCWLSQNFYYFSNKFCCRGKSCTEQLKGNKHRK